MKKYSKIGQLSSIVKNLIMSRQFVGYDEAGAPIFDRNLPLGKQKFIGTVKTHGTNAGVRHCVEGDELKFQSREHYITPLNDNAGFAFFAKSKEITFKKMFSDIRARYEKLSGQSIADRDLIVFGEWVGKGIQKGVAVSEIEKTFLIFDICIPSDDEEKTVYLDMRLFGDICSAGDRIFNVWDARKFPIYEVEMDLEHPALVQNTIIAYTDEVEQKCPVGAYFGVIGYGEGVVWRSADEPKAYMFKVKGEKHSKSKVKKTNLVDVEHLNSVGEFVERFCDEERLEQAYQKMAELGHPYERSTIQHFIRWIISDIIEEEIEAMTESKIEPKDFGGPIGKKASKWFIERIEQL